VGDALASMLGRIESATAGMRTLTAGLAHELRSPLQNLIGETEVMLLSDRSPEDYRRLLASNLEELHDLAGAVDNLLVHCRARDPLRPGRPLLPPEPFDLFDQACLRLERTRRAAERGGVRLELRRSGDTTVVAVREDVLRLVKNLVDNAVKWSPPGGAIEVLVEGDGETVRIVVDDQGPGMPAHLGESIYRPFVRHAGGQQARAGYGLGLSICRSVVDAHGGRLFHEPRAGGGTRFVAELPAKPLHGVTEPAALAT
jgi:two-component system heavy metal sensor histidine kinase CusS